MNNRNTAINLETQSWETVPCDYCHSQEQKLLFSGPDRLTGLPGQFTIVECQSCGLLFQNPRLQWDSLAAYYTEDYVSHIPIIADEPSVLRRLDRRWGMYKLLRAIDRVCPAGGRLLDIGCGTGVFLAEAERWQKWETHGVEPSERAAAYARQKLNGQIVTGNFPDVDLPHNSFDLITMWHVIEHLSKPMESIQAVHHLLKPGGWFVFNFPNVEGVDAGLFKEFWVGWDLPRHLYLYPEKTLHVMLHDTGFRIGSTRCLATSYALVRHDLEFWAQDSPRKENPWVKLLLTIYGSFPARLALILPFWVLGKLKRSPLKTIFVQKMS